MIKLLRLLLLIGIIAIAHPASAQSQIAKIKYEEAEEAYNNKDYTTTMARLDEAVALLKATNPKILYLYILAQTEDLKKQADPSFESITSARKNTALYLQKYENLANNEDKFRDVYKIGETLKKYPATRQEYEAIAKRKLAEAQQKEEETAAERRAEIYRKTKAVQFFDDLCKEFKFKPGLALPDFLVINPEAGLVVKEKSWYDQSKDEYNYRKKQFNASPVDPKITIGPVDIVVRAGIVVHYITVLCPPKSPNSDAIFNKYVRLFTEALGGQLKINDFTDSRYFVLPERSTLVRLSKADNGMVLILFKDARFYQQ